jgi:hypothetical protein
VVSKQELSLSLPHHFRDYVVWTEPTPRTNVSSKCLPSFQNSYITSDSGSSRLAVMGGNKRGCGVCQRAATVHTQ